MISRSSCIAGVGIAAIIDDIGLIFLPMFQNEQMTPKVSFRCDTLEATLCINNTTAFVVNKNKIYGENCIPCDSEMSLFS